MDHNWICGKKMKIENGNKGKDDINSKYKNSLSKTDDGVEDMEIRMK